MPEAVIVSVARSPIGRAFKGSLKDVRGDDLTATIIAAALAKIPELDPNDIEDLMLGCGQPAAEQGFNIARVVTTLMGLDVPGTTVNRYCSSSLQTSRMAMHAIKAGEGDIFVSAGVEMVSRFVLGNADQGQGGADVTNPRFAEAMARTAAREGEGAAKWEETRPELMPDIYISMGQTAENVAQHTGVSRQAQDEFAALSQARAAAAIEAGFYEREITPVELPDGTMMTADDCPRPSTTVEALSGLRTVFRPDGTVTAGNACPLNDGAAAVVIMSDTKAKELGLKPLARIVSTGVSALNPEIMGLGPVDASKMALKRAGLSIKDIDIAEINEAFAVQVLPSADALGIDMDKLNPHGGSIALGHPFGMTGARITNTLINGLQTLDGQFGLETMCVGGGQGMAMIIERL